RYYWFLRLKRLHELIEHGGEECGPMAQQACDMLDDPPGGNYEPYPAIETLARRDAEAHFRRAASSRKKKKRKKKPEFGRRRDGARRRRGVTPAIVRRVRGIPWQCATSTLADQTTSGATTAIRSSTGTAPSTRTKGCAT